MKQKYLKHEYLANSYNWVRRTATELSLFGTIKKLLRLLTILLIMLLRCDYVFEPSIELEFVYSSRSAIQPLKGQGDNMNIIWLSVESNSRVGKEKR